MTIDAWRQAVSLADHECQAVDHGMGCRKRARWYCVPFPLDESLPVEDRGLMVCDDHVASHGLSHSRTVPATRWTIFPLEWGS